MAGYKNFSMSNNAVSAYDTGEKPLSKWTKTEILSEISRLVKSGDLELGCSMDLLKKLPVNELKNAVLKRSSWHHTSSHYNKTDFYSISDSKCAALTNAEIEERINFLKKQPKVKPSEKPAPRIAECTFLEWSGSRAHPKATKITEIGEIKGNWFFRSDGTKKSVTAKGFYVLRELSSDEIQVLKEQTFKEKPSLIGEIGKIKAEQSKEQKSAPNQGQKKARSNEAEI